ncbi:MAG TPA: glycosyltransferase family 2 protein [Polyangia bacterium]
MPKVSVILNCYRQADYVREAVDSALSQTFRDFELIAIDNGSPDETPAILATYQSDPRVRLFLHRDNRTISSRFNEGVRAATGEFVCFLYSDDFYLPHKLETQLRLFEGPAAGCGVVYAPLRTKNQRTGETWTNPAFAIEDDTLLSLLKMSDVSQVDMISPLSRRECFVRHPFQDDVFAEGEGIFLRVALTHRFHYDASPVAVMRDTGENRGRAIRVNVEMHERTLSALESDPAFRPDRYAAALRSYRARLLRNSGFSLLRVGGDVQWAREAIKRSISLSPRDALHPRTVIGLGLSALPGGLRDRVNALGHRLRGVKVGTSSLGGYGGSSGQGS